MLILLLIVGVLAGLAMGEALGGVTGLLLAWLVWRSLQQGRRLKALEATVAALRTGAAVVPETVAAPRPDVLAAPVPAPSEASAAEAGSDTAVFEAGSVPAPEGPDVPAVFVPPPPAPPPAWILRLKDWCLGGNTVVKVGVGLLFIGLAFLARYAVEHVEVPVALRLAGIGAVALALLTVGWRLRERRAGYAQVLQGGAVAVLYLTLFAAFRFYALLPAGVAFAAMALVAVLAAALAVLQEASALAIVGALGGFATPLLLSTGEGSHVALFTYYAVLDLGIAAVAWHRTWPRLTWVGFVCTFVIATGWGVLRYEPAHQASSQAFLVFFFLLFNAVLLMPARHPQALLQGARWVSGSLLFGLPTVTFVLQHGLVREMPYGSAVSALVLAAFYVLLALWLRGRAALAVTMDAALAIATVFLSLVIPFALDARSTAGAWALEGAGLVWLGWRQPRRLTRAFGYGLLFLSALAMQAGLDRHGMPDEPLNAILFNAVMASIASLVAAFHVHRGVRAEPLHPERVAEPWLIGWSLLWALGGAGLQIDRFVPASQQVAAWLGVASLLAVVWTQLSRCLAWPAAGWPPLAHAPFLAMVALLQLVVLASPFDGGRWWGWPVALAAHAWVITHAAPRWTPALRTAVHVLGLCVLAALGALLGRWVTDPWGDAGSAWRWLGWAVVPALLLWAVTRPGLRARWPGRLAPEAYPGHGGAVLATALLLWTVLANIDSDGSARPLPYVPLVNPLDLGVAAACLAVWTWTRDPTARALLAHRHRWPVFALGAVGFGWLNAMLVRAFHHHGGVPFEFEAWTHSLSVQTGLSLLWTATAWVLMWTATRHAVRWPWMVGAALLAAVVAKLMLVDLSGSGTVTRIVSFMGVGVLMLVIGYVAPLPSKEVRDATA